MSALVQDDYAPAAETSLQQSFHRWPLKRLAIAVAGCAVMALSGTGLANYLDTSASTGSGAASADAATLN